MSGHGTSGENASAAYLGVNRNGDEGGTSLEFRWKEENGHGDLEAAHLNEADFDHHDCDHKKRKGGYHDIESDSREKNSSSTERMHNGQASGHMP